MRPKTHRPNRLDKSVTAFCYVPVSDSQLILGQGVLLIRNRSDADMARDREEPVKFDDEGNETGKPRGWGMPGGGMKADDFENPEEAAKNELEGETGFRARIRHFLDPEYKLIKKDRFGKMREESFEKGQTPRVVLERGESAIVNEVHVFEAEIRWEESFLRTLLLQERVSLIARRVCGETEIDNYGIWIELDQLSPEEIEHLGITEKEEVESIGIFPLRSLLTEILEEESRKPRGERAFYISHLRRILRGLEAKGRLEETMGAI